MKKFVWNDDWQSIVLLHCSFEPTCLYNFVYNTSYVLCIISLIYKYIRFELPTAYIQVSKIYKHSI